MNTSLPSSTMPYEPLIKKVGFAIVALIIVFIIIGFLAGTPGDILMGGGMILIGCGISMLGLSSVLALHLWKQRSSDQLITEQQELDSSAEEGKGTLSEASHEAENSFILPVHSHKHPGSSELFYQATHSVQESVHSVHSQSDVIHLKYLDLFFLFSRSIGSSNRDKFDKIIITNFKKNSGTQLQQSLTEIYASILNLQSEQKNLYLRSSQLPYAHSLEESLQSMEEHLDTAAEQCLLFQNEDAFLEKLIQLHRNMRDAESEESIESLSSTLKGSEVFQSIIEFREAIRDFEHSFWKHQSSTNT